MKKALSEKYHTQLPAQGREMGKRESRRPWWVETVCGWKDGSSYRLGEQG